MKYSICHYSFKVIIAIGILFSGASDLLFASDKPLIFPIPQEASITSDIFTMDEEVSIIIPESAREEDLFLARFLIREMSDKYSIALRTENSDKIPDGRKVIVIGSLNNPLIKNYCTENNIILNGDTPGAEGYVLQIKNDKVIIAGYDQAGAFFGLQSLRQVIEAGRGVKLQGVDIRDWPILPFRGIRLYIPGPENFAFFNRFLRDFMALYKFNKVIIEINCMRLDKHPEVNAGWIEFSKELMYSRSNSTQGLRGEEKNSSHYDAGDGFIIEKDDVRDIVELARQNFIEVIPEIPSLTHGYYLLTRHPELAEYPGDVWPDTYCPSNPASYELMFDVYDEYIDVIKPKMIHIGHDEWWGAPLDICPKCNGKDYSELFAGDINKIHNYMSQKGIKIAMWGDHILQSVRTDGPIERISSTGVKYTTPGGLRPSIVKDSIPKDILIFNWFWVNQERDFELNDFGFTQLYGNFKPNISNWDERIKKIDLAGGAPSSWAATNEFNFGKDLMLNFLGCANLLWSNHTLGQVELGAMVREMIPDVRANLSGARIPSEDGNEVETINISDKFNIDKRSKVFDLDLNSIKQGQVKTGSKIFHLEGSREQKPECAVGVSSIGTGQNPLPSQVKGMSINEDVSSLIFLHTAALPAGNQKAYFNIPNFFDTADLLGWYEVVYEDGYKITIPVQYGVNILEWNPGGENSIDKREGKTGSPQNAYCYWADPVDCSSPGASKTVTFYSFEWVNPRFGKKIRQVNLFGSVNYSAQERDYGTVVSSPMPANAIILAALSKVKKRKAFVPAGH